MRMYDIIKKKRDGEKLSEEEIRWFVKGYTRGDIPDYQAAALCMAIFYKGMDRNETAALTLAVRDSGDILDLGIEGMRVDKHSTGGVGDKTSLVVAPVAACCGIKVAKISGRGLGHTGGTVDKLEAIEGYRTDLTTEEFAEIVRKVGVSIIGQSADFAPADKKLYALRDVTATVDSRPLIVSSIMGKKLAANDDCIVLDVKVGSGSFMKNIKDAEALARSMVSVGKSAGKRVLALLTDMDKPLGLAVGNSLEVVEAIETLKGGGPEDFRTLCVELAASMVYLARQEEGSKNAPDMDACRAMVREVIASGKALDKLAEMVQAQGGDPRWIYEPERFPKAKYSLEVRAQEKGYIYRVDTEKYGEVSLILGAGRSTKEDRIDNTAGYILAKKTGEMALKGDLIATLYTTEKPEMLQQAADLMISATGFWKEAPEPVPLVLGTVE